MGASWELVSSLCFYRRMYYPSHRIMGTWEGPQMKLRLEGTKPLTLIDAAHLNLIYWVDVSRLPDKAGIYVFGRRYGSNFEALYVGQATSIRGRVKSQFKNLPLMLHLATAKNGKRVLLGGVFVPKPGQQESKCLPILERALIRYFLSEGHDLVNKQGVQLRRHEVASIGSGRKIPPLMYVDRA
jgi:hypothetical protein